MSSELSSSSSRSKPTTSSTLNEIASSLQRKLLRLDANRSTLETSLEDPCIDFKVLELNVKELKKEQLQLGTDFENAKRTSSSAAVRKLMRDYETVLMPKIDKVFSRLEEVRRMRSALLENQSSSSFSHHQSQETIESDLQHQKQEQISQKEQDLDFTREETASLRLVEKRTAALASLASELATHVSDQGHDSKKIESQSQTSKEDIVSGLSELAEQKKREAYKHVWRGTGVIAAIGGVVGIVGGPIGMALGAGAGAALGAAVGTGITRASRRTIEQEVRDFKLKCKTNIVLDPSSGIRTLTLDVYENQRWGFVGTTKGWSSENLKESFGDPTQWSDEALNELRENTPAPFRPSAPSVFEGWKWRGPWTVEVDSPDSDLSGWRYSFSFAEGKEWSASSYTSSLVRRRRWVRTQIEDKKPSTPPTSKSIEETNQASKEKSDKYTGEAQRHIEASTKNVESALDMTRATLDATLVQGIQIDSASRDSALLEDATAHAERVARAADFTGVLRNVFSFGPKKTNPSLIDDHHHQEEDKKGVYAGTRGGEDEEPSLDRISSLLEQQQRTTNRVKSSVEAQNQQLDAMRSSVERGSNRVEKLLKTQQQKR